MRRIRARAVPGAAPRGLLVQVALERRPESLKEVTKRLEAIASETASAGPIQGDDAKAS